MQTREAHFPCVEHLLDSRDQRQADAMTQLNQVKAEVPFDFAQHFVSGSMTSGVPAGGKRDHAKQQRRPGAPAFRRWTFVRLQVANILAARERARLAQSQRSIPRQSLAPSAYRSDQIVR